MKDLGKLVCFLFVVFLFSCKKEKVENSEIRDRYFNLEKIGWKSRSYTQVVDDIGFTATEVPILFTKKSGN